MSNEEQFIISAILRGVKPSLLSKYRITSADFIHHKDELLYLEQNGVPSRKVFKTIFPEFKVEKITPEDFEFVAEEFRKRKSRFRLGKILESTIGQWDIADPIKLAQQLQSELQNLTNTNGKAEAIDIIKDWKPIYEQMEEKVRLKKEGKTLGISTGIPSLDKAINGLVPQELYVILGFTGEGKSWVQTAMAAAALMQLKRVLYVSLEMPRDRVAFRAHTILSAMLSGNSAGIFTNSSLESGENLDIDSYKKFLVRMERDLRSGMFIVDKYVHSMADLVGLVEEVKPDVVFWDYIGLNLNADDKGIQSWERVGNEAKIAKSVAMKYNIPVVVAAQANRSGSNDRDNAPQLNSIAKSMDIGHHTDRIISLRTNRNELILEVIKNRYGATLKITCEWDVNVGVIKEKGIKLPSRKQLGGSK